LRVSPESEAVLEPIVEQITSLDEVSKVEFVSLRL